MDPNQALTPIRRPPASLPRSPRRAVSCRTVMCFTAMCFTVLPWMVPESAVAEMCAIDAVPAATLLLPYFEVDLDDPQRSTTVFSLHNAVAEPSLAHVILWTDYAVPTVSFDVFLTGFDVVTVNLSDVFQGNLPVTADAANDPGDTTSPHGRPSWDGSFPGCESFLPATNPALQGAALETLVGGHTGAPVAARAGLCLGHDHGDNVGRGYVTIDSVRQCSDVLDPGDMDPGGASGPYFDHGAGIATNDNRLWGEYSYVERAGAAEPSFVSTHPFVHVEAAAGFDAASTPTGATFYGTYLEATGADNREPLATAWSARFLDLLGASGSTDFYVWRDTTDDGLPASGVVCGTGPDWWPLDEIQVLAFNDTEDFTELCNAHPRSSCFPLATQKTAASDLAAPYFAGWYHMNLNHICPTCEPGGGGAIGWVAQSFVTVRHQAQGRHAGGLQAGALAHACDDVSPEIPIQPPH